MNVREQTQAHRGTIMINKNERIRQTLELKKGNSTKTQFEIENPSTVVMTDNHKATQNVKEKRSTPDKD